jgi:hypothetical protein
VAAEIDVINDSWNVDSSSNNVADSVGLMVTLVENALFLFGDVEAK